MKHFYSFLKRKGLFILSEETQDFNINEVHMFNHELMELGYVMTGKLFNVLITRHLDFIASVRNEILDNLNKVMPKDGGVIIYRNFPHDVISSSYGNIQNGFMNYLTTNNLEDICGTHIPTGFTFEPKKLKKIDLISKSEFESIFTDLLYSNSSISKTDKVIVDYFIDNGYSFEFDKITFNETKAYVGKRLMENTTLTSLPIKSATTLLRIYSAYSGGDEGLKENTKFTKPNKRLVKLLASTLEKSYDLEESFKLYREIWLKVLFYLNPMSKAMKYKYPNLYKFAFSLRNEPKTLKTFNSYIESGLKDKDESVLGKLKTRPGVFGRRLDHCVRVFGEKAVTAFLETNVRLNSLVDVYNHFSNRNVSSQRSAILASSKASNLVTYGALEALPEKLVDNIKNQLITRIKTMKHDSLVDKKVYISDKLYYRNMVSNNRGSNFSLSGANGTVEIIGGEKETLRLFTQWYSTDDIDLSGFAVKNDGTVIKVGWDGTHNLNGEIIYSGDNTGRGLINDEYLDINLNKLDSNIEWVICDSRVYRGNNYSNFRNGSPITGWMELSEAESGRAIQKDLIANSMLLSSDSKNVYTIAYNAVKKCIVYLDMSQGNRNITSENEITSIVEYLNSLTNFSLNGTEIDWSKINQGHILNLVSTTVVDDPKDADIIFDENTTFEEVSKYLS